MTRLPLSNSRLDWAKAGAARSSGTRHHARIMGEKTSTGAPTQMRNLCQWTGIAACIVLVGCGGGKPSDSTGGHRAGRAPGGSAPPPEQVAKGPVRRMGAPEARAFLEGHTETLV